MTVRGRALEQFGPMYPRKMRRDVAELGTVAVRAHAPQQQSILSFELDYVNLSEIGDGQCTSYNVRYVNLNWQSQLSRIKRSTETR